MEGEGRGERKGILEEGEKRKKKKKKNGKDNINMINKGTENKTCCQTT